MTPPGPVLLTGFDAFGGLRRNPSELLVEVLAERLPESVVPAILPTSYRGVEDLIPRLLASCRPQAVVMLGYSASAHPLKVELLARNEDSATTADNDGRRGAKVIVPEAPAAYRNTLPLGEVTARLRDLGLRYTVSSDAGGYVCNHAFFLMLHHLGLARGSIPCGFFHVGFALSDAAVFRCLSGGLQSVLEVLVARPLGDERS